MSRFVLYLENIYIRNALIILNINTSNLSSLMDLAVTIYFKKTIFRVEKIIYLNRVSIGLIFQSTSRYCWSEIWHLELDGSLDRYCQYSSHAPSFRARMSQQIALWSKKVINKRRIGWPIWLWNTSQCHTSSNYFRLASQRILVTCLPLLSRYSKTCKALGCGYVQDKMRDAFRREKSSTREPSSYNLVVGFSSRVFEGNGSGRARWGCIYSYLLPVSLYVETLLGIWKWRQMRGYFQITSCVITRTHPDFWLYHISRHTSIISVGIPINILSSYYHTFQ